MANINSKTEARKKVREAQARVNEARLQRERENVNAAASFLVVLGRLAAVDEWEESRVLEIRAEAERRRHEHRQAGAAAVVRMQNRGETLAAIAELAGMKIGDVRAVVKAMSAAREALGVAAGAPVVGVDCASGEGTASYGATDSVAAHAPGANGAAAQDDGVGGLV